jgi:hypothetical protein
MAFTIGRRAPKHSHPSGCRFYADKGAVRSPPER